VKKKKKNWLLLPGGRGRGNDELVPGGKRRGNIPSNKGTGKGLGLGGRGGGKKVPALYL